MMRNVFLLNVVIFFLASASFCSASKRKFRESDDKPNVSDKKTDSSAFSNKKLHSEPTASASNRLSKLSTMSTTEQASINTKDARNVFDFFDGLVLAHILSFNPGLQATLCHCSKDLKQRIDAMNPYQLQLALNLKLPSIAKLPLHFDLKVFEDIVFPDTLEGKRNALILVYKMCEQVLPFSEIKEQLMEIIYDEVAELAQTSPSDYMLFYEATRDSLFSPRKKAFLHYINKRNFDGFLAINSATPSVFGPINDLIRDLISDRNFTAIAVFSECIKENPDRLMSIFDGKLSSCALLCLFAAGLPPETVKGILKPTIQEYKTTEVMSLMLKLLFYPFNTSTPPFNFIAQLQEIIVWIKVSQVVYHSATSNSIQAFNSLLKLAYARFTLPVPGHILTNDSNYNLALLEQFYSFVCIVAKNYEEALARLPNTFAPILSEHIPSNEEFSALLASRRPEWIRTNYAEHQDLLFGNCKLLFAFHRINSFAKFLALPITEEQLRSVLPLIMKHGTLKEVRAFIGLFDNDSVARCFTKFLNLPMSADRYFAITKMFIAVCEARNLWAVGEGPVTKYPDIDSLIYMLENGDDEFFESLRQSPFNVHFSIKQELIRMAMGNDVTWKRLYAVKEKLLRHFNDQVKNTIIIGHSPTEIRYACALLGFEPEQHINEQICSITSLKRNKKISVIDFIVSLIGLCRSLTVPKGVKPVPHSRIDRMWCKSDKSGFLSRLFAALTPRGKSIFMRGSLVAAKYYKYVLLPRAANTVPLEAGNQDQNANVNNAEGNAVNENAAGDGIAENN